MRAQFPRRRLSRRLGFGPDNFAIQRHIALNLLKRSIKRFLAAMDRDYLLKGLDAGTP
ncbi:MAG: hypothetical protein M1546_14390 [Chloroflexi bacterium]|nr:hypothetical protein [Chloroflexota bacterium]